jgi:hypothetical protein
MPFTIQYRKGIHHLLVAADALSRDPRHDSDESPESPTSATQTPDFPRYLDTKPTDYTQPHEVLTLDSISTIRPSVIPLETGTTTPGEMTNHPAHPFAEWTPLQTKEPIHPEELLTSQDMEGDSTTPAMENDHSRPTDSTSQGHSETPPLDNKEAPQQKPLSPGPLCPASPDRTAGLPGPARIAIEGNIGSGKSTVIRRLQEL